MVEEKKREYHPLLRGGRRYNNGCYNHGFSSSQMESLSAVCGAFLPSLHPEQLQFSSPPTSKSVRDFCAATGSDQPVPDEVAGLLNRRGTREGLALVKWVLWALSTRIGTLLLCGFLSLSWSFPFLHRFPEMSVQRRERVLKKWAKEKLFLPLRMAFVILKIYCCYIFFSTTDEKSWNPTWKAIGYQPPAPADGEPTGESTAERPLDEGMLETKSHTNSSLVKSLSQKGFAVAEDSDTIRVNCDAVVIGSGCGGGVAAAVLAAAGHRVIVLEKGNYFVSSDYSSLEAPSMAELYEAGGILATVDGKMMILAGSMVGGGSGVNWSACIKTPTNVMKEWSEERNIPLFGSLRYRTAMDEVWRRIGVTESCSEEGLQNKILRRGCERLGLRVDGVAQNASERHYCGSCCYGCRTAEKRGTDTTWLVDAVENGAVILSGCKAEKFLLESNVGGRPGEKKCVGVAARASGEVTKMIEIRAKATVSACGSLQTPPLMHASGLKNKHIGRNLHLHPVMMAWGYFPETATSPAELRGNKVYQGGIITAIHKITDQESGIHRSIVECAAMSPGSFSTLMPWVSGADVKQRMLRFSRTALFFALVRDTGSGTVQGEGKIRYRFDRSDKEKLREGLRRAMRILAAAGAKEVGTLRSDGQRMSCEGVGEAELGEFLDGIEAVNGPASGADPWGMYFSAHQMGSCRMGATAEEGAVDGAGESWEAEGLFVCDASVLPTAVGVNPMITIEATAHCLAAGIAESSLMAK